MRPTLIQSVPGLALIAAPLVASGSGPAHTVPPNIVIYYADDMGLGDTSAYQDLGLNTDQHQLDTPQMERLAAMGTRFTDAHTAEAVCTPSRISLLTGYYSFRSPIKQLVSYEGQDTHGTLFPGDRRTIAWMLQRRGYRTYGYGKWHLAVQGDEDGSGLMQEGPLQCGFDTYTGSPGNFGTVGSMIRDDAYMSFDINGDLVSIHSPDALTWTPDDNPAFIELVQQTNYEAVSADLADHVANHGQQPFFVYYASHANHTPWVTDDSIAGVPLTTDVTIAGGPVPVQTSPDSDGNGIPEPNDPLYDPVINTHWDPYWEAPSGANPTGTNGPTERAKMIIENDVIIGELLDFLDTTDDPRAPGSKLIDNTLFIFTSDNGADLNALPAVGALPNPGTGTPTYLQGKKGTPWEGGTRVPYIAAWPGRIPAAATSDALISQVDTYATIADIVGHEPEPVEAVDSESILPALTQGQTGVVRDSDLVYKRKEILLLRRGGLKLRASDSDFTDTGDRFDDNLDFLDLQADRLYDVGEDIGETNNRINDGRYTSTAADMLATLSGFVSAGYTRAGASALGNGPNFLGGDFHTNANWAHYTPALDNQQPTLANPGLIAVDGTSTGDVAGARVVQRGGVFDFIDPGSANSALTGGTVWRLEGGVLTDINSAIRVDGATLVIDGGTLDLGSSNNFLRMSKDTSLIELRRGSASASVLAFGVLTSATPGAKVFRFGPGEGDLVLGGNDPIRFGDDGDTANDWIDFVSGSRGSLTIKLDASYFEALWAADRIRIDDQPASVLGGALTDHFLVIDNGDTTTTLRLPVVCDADANADGSVNFFDVLDLLARYDAGDESADVDGSAVLQPADEILFIGRLQGACP